MKTKPFLLATAGSTVDGREINAEMLTQMAEGYDPKTYGARLNLEHIRGMSGDRPFRAFGDVLELSTREVDVNFHGTSEKRLGLFGVLDVNDEAKELNDAGQKVYPSIEIEPNFAGKGKAYLMGVGLTDRPASIATERMAFNRSLPGTITLGADRPDQAFTIEFADAASNSQDAADGFLAKLGDLFDRTFNASAAPAAGAPVGDAPAEAVNEQLSADALRPLFEGIGQQFADQIGSLQTQIADQRDLDELRFKAIEAAQAKTPAHTYTARPQAAGANGSTVKTDC